MVIRPAEDWKSGDTGLFADLPSAEYHAAEGCSQSRLKTMRDRSPAHVKWEMENPTPQTDAMAIGAAIHDAILLPAIFESRYKRGIEGDGRKKEVKEARQALSIKHPDAVILSPDVYDACEAVRLAVANHPIARRLLEGDAECSARWKDEETGVLCKGRFDLVGRHQTLVDLKTTKDASPQSFQRDVYNHGYYLQAAMYLRGAKALGLDIEHYAIIAVEKEPPYGVAIYRLEDAAIRAGGMELERLLQTWSECDKTGIWPGYEQDPVSLAMPDYAYYQINDRLGIAA